MLRSPSPSDAAPKSGASAPSSLHEVVRVGQVRDRGGRRRNPAAASPSITVAFGAPSRRSRISCAYGPVTACIASNSMRKSARQQRPHARRSRTALHERRRSPPPGRSTSTRIVADACRPSRRVGRRACRRSRYCVISACASAMAAVTASGAGPPFAMLYLMPKSPSGPPGLWLADRMMPAVRRRARGSRTTPRASTGCRRARRGRARRHSPPPSSARSGSPRDCRNGRRRRPRASQPPAAPRRRGSPARNSRGSRLLEHGHALAQPRRSGRLIGERSSRNGAHREVPGIARRPRGRSPPPANLPPESPPRHHENLLPTSETPVREPQVGTP